MRSDSQEPVKKCLACGKEVERYYNYCNWDCHVQHAKDEGGVVHCPNGLPVRCITRDNVLIECEHGDHPDYKFPVEVGRERFLDRDDERKFNDIHALIYADDSIALTMYECNYAVWSLSTGLILHCPSWTRGQRLTDESLKQIRERFPRRDVPQD